MAMNMPVNMQAKPPLPNMGMFASMLAKMQPPAQGGAFPQMQTFGGTGGFPQMPTGGGVPDLTKMPNMFGSPEMNIDQFGQKFGIDYSKQFATDQANVIKQAKNDAYNSQLRQVQSGVDSSVNNLDHDYFKTMLQKSQDQVNTGMNSGIAADQDLRLAMNRQNAMGDIYRDANNRNADIQDNLGRLDAESLALSNQMYDDRRQQGLQNTMNYNQLQNNNASTYAEYMRNITNDNRDYALKEGDLMGNYIPYEARSLVETVLKSKDQLNKTNNLAEKQQILTSANDARIKLSSMGVNVDRIGTTATFNNALGSVSSMNKTMAGQQNDMSLANQVAAQTGVFTDPRAQQLYQTLLGLKSNVERKGGATAEEANQMMALRGQLSGYGVDANKLIGSNVFYGNALANAAQLGTKTLGSKRQEADISNERTQLMNDLTKINGDYNLGATQNAINLFGAKNDYALGSQQNANTLTLGLGQNANDKLKIGNDYNLGLGQNANDKLQIGNTYKLGMAENKTTAKNNSYNYVLGKQGNANDKLQIGNTYKLGVGQNKNDATKNSNDYKLGYSQNKNDATKIGNDYRLGNAQNANDASKISSDYQIGLGQNANDATQINNDYSVQTEKNKIDKQLGEYDYKIATAEADYKKAEVEVKAAKAKWDQKSKEEKKTAKANTDAVTAELVGKSKSEAIAAFGKNYKNWIKNGVDVIKVMDALGLTDLMKPAKKDKSGSGSNPLEDYFGGK